MLRTLVTIGCRYSHVNVQDGDFPSSKKSLPFIETHMKLYYSILRISITF
jgi:hypothetical protein